ncbi:addiction module protein [Phragmitibacter flavus]|nr:addiction module protein [Phragmitibacter flavus]
MSVAEVSKLPLREKLQIMEAIWQDLRERADEVDVPLEQRRLLDARRERVTAGNSRLLDWDEAKLMIGKK